MAGLRELCLRQGEFVMVNVETGEVRALPCERNRCPYCGPRKAIVTAQAIRQSKPTVGITVTDLPETWGEIQPVMQRIVRSLHRKFDLEVVYQVESNPSGKRCHAHMFGRGSTPGEAAVRAIASGAGAGHVAHVARVRGNPGYGLKEVTVLSDLDDPSEILGPLHGFLDRNGGRFAHGTRRFWLDQRGRPTTMRGAMRRSEGSGRGGSFVGDSLWVQCRRAEVGKVLRWYR